MNIYLASPLGFAESTKAFIAELKELLTHSDVTIFDPWENLLGAEFEKASTITDKDKRIERFRSLNKQIAESNEEGIRNCDLVVAVLDGVDVDSGTASEIGFAYALGKRILGLRTDFRLAGENEASEVNLQVQYWIEASGGTIAKSKKQLKELVQEYINKTS